MCAVEQIQLAQSQVTLCFSELHVSKLDKLFNNKIILISILFSAQMINNYALLTKCEVKMAGYLATLKSRSIKTQKKNEANIQPS